MWLLTVLALLSGLGPAPLRAQEPAFDIYERGREAEKAGQIVRAYLLYAQAAGMEPNERKYWARAQALRTKALLLASQTPLAPKQDSQPPRAHSDELLEPIGDSELAESRKPLPPAELQGAPGLRDFDLRGDAKALWEQVSKAFGLDVLFDEEYQAGQPIRFRLSEVDFHDAVRSLAAATNSFLVPVTERVAMVVKDTPQKRQTSEPTVAVTLSIPTSVAVQEAQELARSVQQLLEIQKFAIDSARRLVLMRDRVGKVRVAQRLYEQLLTQRGQVVIEIELLNIAQQSSLNYGVSLQTMFSLVNFGRSTLPGSNERINILPSIPAGFTKFLVFGGGRTFMGLGITDAQLFADMTKANATSLLTATLRSVEGQPATLHVGDRYPIPQNAYLGDTSGSGTVYRPPPTFTFEDLGLTIKITARVHDQTDVSLQVEAEFKLLGGGNYNGIPVISNRKFASQVRIRDGEWAVMAGLLTADEARTVSGLAGLTQLPAVGHLFGQNTRSKNSGEVLLVIKPHIIDSSATQTITPQIYTGAEGRWPTGY